MNASSERMVFVVQKRHELFDLIWIAAGQTFCGRSELKPQQVK